MTIQRPEERMQGSGMVGRIGKTACSCTPAPALRLLHSCSCTPAPALLLLHSCSCTPAPALLLLHSCSCTPAPALLLLHSCSCSCSCFSSCCCCCYIAKGRPGRLLSWRWLILRCRTVTLHRPGEIGVVLNYKKVRQHTMVSAFWCVIHVAAIVETVLVTLVCCAQTTRVNSCV